MSLLRNEKVCWGIVSSHVECWCPYCRFWKVVWGGETTYRGRRICSSCSWILDKMQHAPRTAPNTTNEPIKAAPTVDRPHAE